MVLFVSRLAPVEEIKNPPARVTSTPHYWGGFRSRDLHQIPIASPYVLNGARVYRIDYSRAIKRSDLQFLKSIQ